MSLNASRILTPTLLLFAIGHIYGFTLSSDHHFGLSRRCKHIPSLDSTECLQHIHSAHPDELGEASTFSKAPAKHFEHRKKEWIDRSVKYYTTIRRMRSHDVEAHSKSEEAIDQEAAAEELEALNRKEFIELATRHYTALRKVKDGEFYHAEKICKFIMSRNAYPVNASRVPLTFPILFSLH